ncbi:hypothetical protein SMC1_09950 [Candidatus Cryosericum septentrionale]|uniref:Thioredoxin domain-containing protein n=1 Tax=Candidatus Cryosericum septentrionale TaxID=2290913 RepID=A0A398DUA1_9BACT|nr:hypothetical protein SMC1_09950 [Candidatus Cryosericum septentrionale]
MVAVLGVATVVAVILTARASVVARAALAAAVSRVEQEYAATLNPGDVFPLASLPSAAGGPAIRLRDRQTCCIVVAPGCATCSEYAGVAEGLGRQYPGVQVVLLMVGSDGQGVVAGPHMVLAVDQDRAAVGQPCDHDARAPAVFLIRPDGTIAWKSVGIKLQLVWTELNQALGQFGGSGSGSLLGGEVTPKVGEKLAAATCGGASVVPLSTDKSTVFLLSHSTYLSADSMKLHVDFLARLRDFADPVLVASVYDEVRWRAACDYAVLYSTASTQTSTQNLRLLPSINRGEVAKVEDYVQQNHLGVMVIADTCWSFALRYGQFQPINMLVVAPDGTVKAIVPWDLQGPTEEAALVRYVRNVVQGR